MVIEEDYSQGMGSYLNGQIKTKDVLDTAKAILYPGYGFLAVGIILKAGLFYGGKVAATGDWNPFRFGLKQGTEQADVHLEKGEAVMKSSLEKTLYYKDIEK